MMRPAMENATKLDPFVSYVLSPAGQQSVLEQGFVPVLPVSAGNPEK